MCCNNRGFDRGRRKAASGFCIIRNIPKEENAHADVSSDHEAEKEAICAWQYPGEYAMYNNPPYAEQKKHGYGFANPANNFYSFYDAETLVGFVNLSDEGSEVFFGIGAHPDHCGQGYGTQMTALAWDLSQRLYPGKPMYLEVRTWNTRAVRCYEKAGFRVVGEPVKRVTLSGEGTFYHMVRQAQG